MSRPDPSQPLFNHSKTLFYLGEEEGRKVLYKVLKKEEVTPRELAAFNNEYNILRSIDRPGIRKVRHLERIEGRHALVLDYLEGQDLGQLSEPPGLDEFLSLALKAARILAEVHQLNLIHKDIKPENFIYDQTTGDLTLIDFGLASRFDSRAGFLVQTDRLEGSLNYISPEQTGRMNRSVDQRSDLYSLGATFYRLLCGQAPFSSSDQLELVHSHIARRPTPLTQHLADIPQVLSDLVGKLLEKNAEDRYQSASGLAADLEQCLVDLRQRGRVAPFPLGQSDISRVFQLPEKLYGRQAEARVLLEAFDQVRGGAKEMVLVSGHSGTGKSALVQELYRPVTLSNGFFLSGKFEKLQRDIPYSALVEAFDEFVEHLVFHGGEVSAYWKERILSALGDLGGVMTGLLPGLEGLLGPQPVVPELKDQEAHNRLLYVFRRFLGVLATDAHPFVVFLDDLQWADLASLELLRAVVNDPEMNHLLVICAYRDNEVGDQHPLTRTLAEIEAAQGGLRRLPLGVLPYEDIAQLASEALKRPLNQVEPLVRVLLQKTDGNAFFARQFLHSLAQQGVIRFDEQANCWTWDQAALEAQEATENVVEFLRQKLEYLPDHTRRLLQYASCVGTRFDLLSLRAATEEPLSEVARGLEAALIAGVVSPVGADYHLIFNSSSEEFGGDSQCLFVHDRLQEAVYASLDEQERGRAHYRIGQLLLSLEDNMDKVSAPFSIANQLNLGAGCIHTADELRQLAQLNLQAGKRAQDAAAFTSAYHYFKPGVELLEDSHWDSDYRLCLELYEGLAHTAYLRGKLDEAESYANRGIARAKSRLDAVDLHVTLMKVARGRYQPERVLTIGLDILKLLGVTFPSDPKPPHIIASLAKTKLALRRHQIEELVDLPEMSDPDKIKAMMLITTMIPDAFRLGSNLFPLFVLKEVQLSLKYGNHAISLFGYAAFGITLSGVLGDLRGGYRFGKLALSMLERIKDAKSFEPHVQYITCNFLRHWQEPLADYVDDFMKAYQTGLETGIHYEAAWGALGRGAWGFFTGREFALITEQLAETHEVLNQDEAAASVARMLRQTIENLRSGADEPTRLLGEIYDETAGHQHAPAESGYLYCFKALLGLVFGDPDAALEACRALEANTDGILATPMVSLLAFYSAWARLQIFQRDQGPKTLLKPVRASIKKLRKLARSVPETHQHRVDLLEAEWARAQGDLARARECLDRAITQVRRQQSTLEEALILERAARFYLAMGQRTFSTPLAQLAHSCYARLGAQAKMKALAQDFGSLLYMSDRSDSEQTQSSGLGTYSSSSGSQALDLHAVIKASQAISGEIKLESLVEKLMQVMLEAGGAEKAVLALERDGHLGVQAYSDAEGQWRGFNEGGQALDTFKQASTAVIRYVARSRQSVVLADALKDNRFLSDSYIQEEGVKSLLCTPILSHGRLMGVLYLENNLLFGAFTPLRLQVLNTLSAQAAISLENALLYRTMEQQVAQRTVELDEANRTKDQFFSIISHDLRGPMGSLSVIFNEVLHSAQDFDDAMLSGVRVTTKQTYELLENLLTWANNQRGQLKFEPRAFEINESIEDTLQLMQGNAKQKGVALHFERGERYHVNGDRSMITTVVRNLLGNALKFTEPGGEVRLELKKRQGFLEVVVRDTGIGMGPEQLEQLFKVSSKLHSRRGTANEAGTGLGLVLCHDFVVKNGGQITAESQPGQGSLFRFTVPLAMTQPVFSEHHGIKNLKLLVVEDNPLHLKATTKVLSDLGAAFEAVGDAESAAQRLQAGGWDMVLMDVELPSMNGVEAAWQGGRSGQRPKLVALTSLSAAEVAQRRTAVDGHLEKPLKSQELLDLVDRISGQA